MDMVDIEDFLMFKEWVKKKLECDMGLLFLGVLNDFCMVEIMFNVDGKLW